MAKDSGGTAFVAQLQEPRVHPWDSLESVDSYGTREVRWVYLIHKNLSRGRWALKSVT